MHVCMKRWASFNVRIRLHAQPHIPFIFTCTATCNCATQRHVQTHTDPTLTHDTTQKTLHKESRHIDTRYYAIDIPQAMLYSSGSVSRMSSPTVFWRTFAFVTSDSLMRASVIFSVTTTVTCWCISLTVFRI